MLRPMVIRPWYQAPHLGPVTHFYLFVLISLDICEFVDVGRPLWREGGPVVNIRCWVSPAQSFSGLSPTGYIIEFYYLNFETPSIWWVRLSIYFSQEQCSPLMAPGTGLLFQIFKTLNAVAVAFWVVTSYSLVVRGICSLLLRKYPRAHISGLQRRLVKTKSRRYRRIYSFHLQGRSVSQARNYQAAQVWYIFILLRRGWLSELQTKKR
jgi:hypothetical protein